MSFYFYFCVWLHEQNRTEKKVTHEKCCNLNCNQSEHFFCIFFSLSLSRVLCIFRPLSSSWDLNSLNSPLLIDPYHKMFDLYYEKLLENIPENILTEVNSSSDIRFVYSVCVFRVLLCVALCWR